MNIDILNAHYSPRIQFLDHAWLNCSRNSNTACVSLLFDLPFFIFFFFFVISAVLKSNVSESDIKNQEQVTRRKYATLRRSLAFVAVMTEITESKCICSCHGPAWVFSVSWVVHVTDDRPCSPLHDCFQRYFVPVTVSIRPPLDHKLYTAPLTLFETNISAILW